MDFGKPFDIHFKFHGLYILWILIHKILIENNIHHKMKKSKKTLFIGNIFLYVKAIKFKLVTTGKIVHSKLAILINKMISS